MVAELVAAGIEGGSWDAVLDRWTLDRVSAIRKHWAECGPPAHIGIAALSAAWGNKLTLDPRPAKAERTVVPIDLSEGALDGVQMPVAGGDTLAASQAVLERLKQMHAI